MEGKCLSPEDNFSNYILFIYKISHRKRKYLKIEAFENCECENRSSAKSELKRLSSADPDQPGASYIFIHNNMKLP